MNTAIRLVTDGNTCLKVFNTDNAIDQLKIFNFMKDNDISIFIRGDGTHEYFIRDIYYLFPSNSEELPVIEVWVEE